MRTLNLQDPNPSPGEFYDNLRSGHKKQVSDLWEYIRISIFDFNGQIPKTKI
jgi:hypothetical protein